MLHSTKHILSFIEHIRGVPGGHFETTESSSTVIAGKYCNISSEAKEMVWLYVIRFLRVRARIIVLYKVE